MLRLYNTLSRQEEPFAPVRDATVRMYVCGPTVYARAHIGNFRTYVCVDVLRRTLKHLCGYTIREAINYTDVDDKTIAGAQKAGVPLRDIAMIIEATDEDAPVLLSKSAQNQCTVQVSRLEQRRMALQEALAELNHVYALLTSKIAGQDAARRD